MIHIETLVLRSTEFEDLPKPATATMTESMPTSIDNSEYINEQPGYSIKLKQGEMPEILYHIFSLSPVLGWQKKVIHFFKKEFPSKIRCTNIVVDASHNEAARIFCDLVLQSPHTTRLNLVLSNKAALLLESYNLHYYYAIKPYFIMENEFNEYEDKQQRILKVQNHNLSDRLFWVARNSKFTDLERRIYLYFYGKTLKASREKNYDYLMLYYDEVANDFIGKLNVQKKEIYKAMDSLKKKRLLQIQHKSGHKIFVLTTNGPVDMLDGVLQYAL